MVGDLTSTGNDTLIGLAGIDETDGGRGMNVIEGSENEDYLIGGPPAVIMLTVRMGMITCLGVYGTANPTTVKHDVIGSLACHSHMAVVA